MERERGGDLSLAHYAGVLWCWLWLVVLASALAGGTAYLVSARMTPIYEASTTLLISEGEKVSGPDYDSVLMSERLARTYSQMLTDTPVLDEVSARLGLDIPEEQLARMTTVDTIRDTLLIRLRVRGANPALAATIANTLPQVFIEQHQQHGAARYTSSMQSLDREMQQLETQAEATQQALEAERSSAEPNSAELVRLETLANQYRSTYASMLQSYEELRVAEARGADTVIVTKAAKVPIEPVLPRTSLNTLLATVVGAALAAGIGLVLDYLDDTVKSEAEVQQVAHLPTLATILRFSHSEASKDLPLMAAHPDSAVAEAYRLLRTNLQFATVGMGRSAVTLVVTSSEPQEGKTTTAANIGVSLAQIGKKVLLVDTDLRRPALHTRFGLGNSVGLTSLFLQQDPDPESTISDTGLNGLRLLTSGPVPANPAELLEFPQFAAILTRLQELADYVILDSPPVLSVADASILAQRADGVLLVTQPGTTRSEALRNSALSLRRVNARLLGVVLNKASRGSGRYYRYYQALYRAATHGRGRRQRKPAAAAPEPGPSALGQS